MASYYFVGLTWQGGYASGFEGTQFGPFSSAEDAEKIRVWFLEQTNNGFYGYASPVWGTP